MFHEALFMNHGVYVPVMNWCKGTKRCWLGRFVLWRYASA